MSEILDAINRHRTELLRNEAAAAREMASAYDDALRQVRAELEKSLAASRLSGSTTKGQAIDRWRLRKLEQQIRTEMSHFAAVAAGQTTQAKRDAVDAAAAHTQTVLDASVANTGITSAMADLDQRAVRNIVGTTRPGSPLRALLDDAAGQSADGMVKALRNGIIAGHDVRTIAKNMREDGLIGRNRSILIARTEANRAYQEATHERYASSDVVTGWIWLSSLDRRSCAACLAKHGSRHPMTEPLRDHPPKRCDELPIIDGIDPPEIEDAGKWLRGQPAHVQENSLGSKAAAEAFRKGEVALPDFVGLRRSARWGDNYYRTSLKQALVNADERRSRRKPDPPSLNHEEFKGLISQIAIGGHTPSQSDVEEILGHVWEANLANRDRKVDPSLRDVVVDGKPLGAIAPSDAMHLGQRIVEKQWSADTTVPEYGTDIRASVEDVHGEIAVYHRHGQTVVGVLCRNAQPAIRSESGSQNLVYVVYNPNYDAITTAYQCSGKSALSIEEGTKWHSR